MSTARLEAHCLTCVDVVLFPSTGFLWSRSPQPTADGGSKSSYSQGSLRCPWLPHTLEDADETSDLCRASLLFPMESFFGAPEKLGHCDMKLEKLMTAELSSARLCGFSLSLCPTVSQSPAGSGFSFQKAEVPHHSPLLRNPRNPKVLVPLLSPSLPSPPSFLSALDLKPSVTLYLLSLNLDQTLPFLHFHDFLLEADTGFIMGKAHSKLLKINSSLLR